MQAIADHRADHRPLTGAGWGQERRLEFIDFRLLWDGRINRAELVEFFGMSIQQASLDLAKYMELAPGNLEYNRSQKVYRAAAAFQAIFVQPDALAFLAQLSGATAGVWPAALSFLGWRPPYDRVPQPARSIPPQILMRVLWAIRDHEDLDITYQAMSEPAAVRRWISPHAIASDGSRWHTRAWSHERGYFKDFVLARIQSIHDERASEVEAETDAQWHTQITVVLRASRNLTLGQRRAVETEFGMHEGELTVAMRHALLPYFIRQWRLEESAHTPLRAPLLEWVNKADLQAQPPKAAKR
jgi:WYL domain-containing protein